MSRPNEPRELESALIAGLALQASKLSDVAADLKDATRFSRTMKIVTAVGMALLIGLTWIALQNRANGQAARQSLATIRDCTTPGGHCYEQSRSATGQAVAQIVAGVNAHTDLVFLAAFECSRRPYHADAAFEACLRSKGLR